MYLRRWAHVTHVNRTLCHETNGDQGAGLQSCYQGEVELRCAPMSKNLQSRFLSCKALWGDPGGEHMAGSGTVGSRGITIQEKQPEQLCPVLHGTEDRNLPSIYQKGPDFAGMRQMDSNWVVIFFLPQNCLSIFTIFYRPRSCLGCWAAGLLVPTGQNNVRVLNGSSHGKGIYTAKTQNTAPQLAAVHMHHHASMVY
jgi:hypothetical protein